MKNKKPKIEFTGERLIPELNKGYAFFYEHLARYLFSCQFTKNKVVLDAGCGVGYGSFVISTTGGAKKVWGVDLSKDAIKYAKQKYPQSNLNFGIDDVGKLDSIPDNSIDLALAFEVIEHVSDPVQTLTTLKKKLKPNGILIVSTPNKNTYPDGNPYHIKEYRPEEFVDLLNNHFKYQKIFHQVFEFSQNIKQESNQVFTLEENFTQTLEKVFTPVLNPKNSQYLLAVVSDVELPPIETLAINTSNVDGFDLEKGIISLIDQQKDLRQEVQKLKGEAVNYQGEISSLLKELETIKTSKAFKLRQSYHKLRKVIRI